MKVFLSIGMFLMFFVSLSSAQNNAEEVYPDVYPKKIVFGTYSKKSSAKYELHTFRKDKIYKELYELALKNNFMIHYRPLAEYTILVIEPIHKRNVFFNVLNLIRQKYPRAYHLSAEGLDEQIKKPLPPLTQKSFKTAKKKPCLPTKTSAKIEEPIFNVEEVSDAEMAVNCIPATKKDIKKVQKPKKEVKPKAESIVASSDVKQEAADVLNHKQTTDKVEKQEADNKVENKEPKQKAKPVQKSDVQKTQTTKTDKTEESFFASILSYFTSSEKKSELKKPKPELKEVKKENEPVQADNSDKTASAGMDVPALDEPVALALDDEALQQQKSELNKDMNKSDSSSVNSFDEADALDVDDNQEETLFAKNDLNITKKSIGEEKNAEHEDAKYTVKSVKENNQTKTANETHIDKKMAEALKKEQNKTEKSYFTFSNVVMGLLLIFSPFLYKKFRKLKSIYDQY